MICALHGDIDMKATCITNVSDMFAGGNMRITLDIPDSLMSSAMKASHQRTKTAVIIKALQELVRNRQLQDLIASSVSAERNQQGRYSGRDHCPVESIQTVRFRR